MHLTPDGDSTELDVEGALLGIFPEEQFPLQRVQLQPGDSILFYSDGFESAFTDPAGLVNERYREEFAGLAGVNAPKRFQEMVDKLDNQEGSLHQRDDLTALMMTIASADITSHTSN